MKHFFITLITVLSVSVSAVAADVDCSAADVDQADDPNFAQKISKCESDPVIRWDLNSRGSFLSKRGKVVNTYEAYQGVPAGEAVIQEQIVVPTSGESAGRHYAGTTFLIREFFRMDGEGGPVAAVTVIAEMTKQMAAHCSEGWEKEREWTERRGKGFYLHYQFTCSGDYKGS